MFPILCFLQEKNKQESILYGEKTPLRIWVFTRRWKAAKHHNNLPKKKNIFF